MSGLPRQLLSSILNLLFPPRCASCGQAGSWFCSSCLARVEWITPPFCLHCGEPIPPGERCPRWRHHLPELAGLRSAAWHSEPLRTAIHRFKYGGQRILAAPLGDILSEAWRRQPLPVDLLIPVPLHARRIRERGYNQATLLAERLSQQAGLPVDTRSLQRRRHTPPQVGLKAAARLTNVEGAFVYQGPSLQGSTVCLIDDICTTGATLRACALALYEARASAVWALTLARPHWGSTDGFQGF